MGEYIYLEEKYWLKIRIGWMNKEDVVCLYACVCVCVCVYTHNGILLSHKKDEILLFSATWMDLEGIMLSEISQTEKDKYYMIPLICVVSKIQQSVNMKVLVVQSSPWILEWVAISSSRVSSWPRDHPYPFQICNTDSLFLIDRVFLIFMTLILKYINYDMATQKTQP